MAQSPFEILGVDKNAAAKEITLAYRRLAMRWHPDRNPEAVAKEKFQEIEAAYRKLQDGGFLGESAAGFNNEESRGESPGFNNEDSRNQGDDQGRRGEDSFAGESAAESSHAFLRFVGEVPWLSVLFLSLGAGGFWLSDDGKIGGGLFSAGVLLSYHFYRFGKTAAAYYLGTAFRMAVPLYFVALLAWVIVDLGKEIVQ